MARIKGSTRPLEPMKTRDPKAFALIAAEIQRLGPKEIAKYAKVSAPTVYNFLSGIQGVSQLIEARIYSGVTDKKAADKKKAQSLRDQALEAIIS